MKPPVGDASPEPLVPYFAPLHYNGGRNLPEPLDDDEPPEPEPPPTDPVTGSCNDLRCMCCGLPFSSSLRLEDPLCLIIPSKGSSMIDTLFGPIHHCCIELLFSSL